MNKIETTIDGAVSDAFSELEGLAQEMRDAFENTPENFKASGVGEARGEAADALEGLSEPDVPEELAGDKFKVTWEEQALSPSALRRQSRASRRDGALRGLQETVSKLEEIEADKETSSDLKEAASSLKGEIENLVSEAEAVEFPGMRG